MRFAITGAPSQQQPCFHISETLLQHACSTSSFHPPNILYPCISLFYFIRLPFMFEVFILPSHTSFSTVWAPGWMTSWCHRSWINYITIDKLLTYTLRHAYIYIYVYMSMNISFCPFRPLLLLLFHSLLQTATLLMTKLAQPLEHMMASSCLDSSYQPKVSSLSLSTLLFLSFSWIIIY